MKNVKDRIRALARDTGWSGKASVADFLRWRAGERVNEATGIDNTPERWGASEPSRK